MGPPRYAEEVAFDLSPLDLPHSWQRRSLGPANNSAADKSFAGRPEPGCDWKHWYATEAYGNSRPSNELLWIRDLHGPAHAFRDSSKPFDPGDDLPDSLRTPEWAARFKKERRDYLREERTLDGLLLQGVAALVGVLRQRLEAHFEMNWLTDIFMEWKGLKEETARYGRRDRLVPWTIENVRVRNERLERQELAAMPKAVGCTQARLMEDYREVSLPTKRGVPIEDGKPERMAKQLKKVGYPKVMPAIVRRWVLLLRKYSPELFPKPTPPSRPLAAPNVVPFKR